MNMSFMLTEAQVAARTKDVTRRIGWRRLRPGDSLRPVRKCQGLRKGEQVQRIGSSSLVVLQVARERLRRLLDDFEYGRREVDREGFPDQTVQWFVDMFCRANGCTPDTEVTRIEFRYEG